ncbi:flagellar hook-associated protein FlgK [Virgibacillus halophilus]|uniref:Flagellar hook-associated protein 1 n=1 Tax=Tigheibacillus halophilus TaxID=361280 RepID=A0ABU5C310_9BACI|nr:flagellar hook-associated protein FlgK [Virgibacillus halophilus]
MSTFHGLEMAKQALFAQQAALYTTGNNISNANTEGYTRQRVNFETMSPYPSASRNRPEMPGQMGTGVRAGTIERVRNEYLDTQYRGENSKAGYWQTKSDALSRMESLLNEPSENGLSNTMDKFWQSLQDLASNPENSGARSVVAQRGEALADTFNYLQSSLSTIRSDLSNQMDVTVSNANSILKQINNINAQVKEIEPHGYLANDLYDERDRLIDQLSSIVNVKVSYSKSGDGALESAPGLATVELVNDSGKSFDPKMTLVDGTKTGDEAINRFEFNGDEDSASVSIEGKTLPLSGVSQTGALNALIHSYNNDYPDMQKQLEDMAIAFKNEFNKVHSLGVDKNGEPGIEFFEIDNDGKMKVNADILKNKDLIAASTDKTMNGDNAKNLADIFQKKRSRNWRKQNLREKLFPIHHWRYGGQGTGSE